MDNAQAALIDPRIPPLVRVLRDGTDEQVNSAYNGLIAVCGTTRGHELWHAALREVEITTPTTTQPQES